jgi:signal transduction histidine kinase
VEAQWQGSEAELASDLAAELPPVLGNADHLQSVWVNLLLNAHDAMEGRSGCVIVRSWAEGKQVVVQVEDEGVGIPPEELERIFEPFYTTKEPGKGTGLGLATTYRIVEQHRGTIDVGSIPDSGTTVTVWLPVESTR